MEESSSQRKIEDYKPKAKTLERLELLDFQAGKTVVMAKIDGEFSLLSYTRDGESYIVNKWGHRREDFPALNQFIEAMNQTNVAHAELLCELYAKENGKPLPLPTFIHYVKSKDEALLRKVHIGVWDLIKINGYEPKENLAWKLKEVEGWLKECSLVSVVPYIIPQSLREIREFWKTRVEEQGYEGLVIRNEHETWKIKPSLELDAVIIGLNKKTSYGKTLNLFQQHEITSIKVALMQPDGTLIELSDCASGINAELRTVLWKLMDFKVSEDDKTVYIKPLVVCTIQYTDTYPKNRQILKFNGEKYTEVGKKRLVSLRHPRLIRFRPDKNVTPQDLRISQIPENKLPEPEPEPPKKQNLEPLFKEKGKVMVDEEYIRKVEKEKFCPICGGKIEVTEYPNFRCLGCGFTQNINFFWNDKMLEYYKEGKLWTSDIDRYEYVKKVAEAEEREKEPQPKEEPKPTEDVLEIVRDMEKQTLGTVHDEIRKDWKRVVPPVKEVLERTREEVLAKREESSPFSVTVVKGETADEYWRRNNTCVEALKQVALTRISEEELEKVRWSCHNIEDISDEFMDECWNRVEHPEWFGHSDYYIKPYLALCVKLGLGEEAYRFLNDGTAFPHKPPEQKFECPRQAFPDYYNCIAHYREKCPLPLLQMCKEKSEQPKPSVDEVRKVSEAVKTNYVGWICLKCGWRKPHGRAEAIDHARENEGHDVGWLVNGKFEPLKSPSLPKPFEKPQPCQDTVKEAIKEFQEKEEVKTGVPEGFYPNRYLVNINKGFLRPDQAKEIPKELKCWAEGCDKPLVVCGYPFYICENDHAYNHQTGEKWNWKPYDDVYHGLLNILQGKIEPTYQKLFFPQSRKTEHTEASQVSTHLGQIGGMLYDKLEIQEEDPYRWGRDNLRHFAGLRFAINMMTRHLNIRSKIQFPSSIPHPAQIESLEDAYSYDAEEYLKTLGEETVKQMLLNENYEQAVFDRFYGEAKETRQRGLSDFF